MNKRLSRINLNLLVALNTLLKERNVTRAAAKMFISQSAMSSTLSQLRDLFQDDLLIRSKGEMIPTPLAESITPKLKEILDQVQNFFESTEEFDPKKSTRVFRIGCSEYIEIILTTTLYKYMAKNAPNVQLIFKHIAPIYDLAQFDNEMIDLGISVESKKIHPQLMIEELFQDESICLARKNHPLMKKKMTQEDYINAKHVTGSGMCGLFKSVDATLQGTAKRQVPIMLSHVMPAFELIEKTDLLASLPKKIALHYLKKFSLTSQELPFSLPKKNILLLWPKKIKNDIGISWLKKVIIDHLKQP